MWRRSDQKGGGLREMWRGRERRE